MAKLQGVKTLDMVNGEITKVEYNGSVYTRIEDEVKTGDLVLSKGVRDASSGNFYEVNVKDSFDDDAILDDISSKRSNLNSFEVFRKLLESQSLNANDTQPFKEGDRVKALVDGEYCDVKVGETGKVTNIDAGLGDKDPYSICVQTKDNHDYFRPQDLEKVEEEGPETITFEGAEYTLVDRKAQPGDVVVFTENESTCFENYTPYGEVKKNEIGELIVKSEVGNSFKVYTYTFNRTPDNVKVYAPVVDEEPYQPAEGDIVVITANTNSSRNEVGDIGKIGEVNLHTNAAKVDVPDKPNALGAYGNWTKFSEMRPATDEEKAQYEKAVKFTRLGRKPNEYKKGDIVRGERYDDSSAKFLGIVEDISSSMIGVRSGDNRYHAAEKAKSELIAPVESRIDTEVVK